MASLIGVTIVVTVMLAVKTDNNGFDPDSSEYALYKNSGFKDCYNNPPPVANDCTAIESIVRATVGYNLRPQNISYISNLKMVNESTSETRKALYDWCDVVSCFNEFKIVPSSIRPTAFWTTTIGASTKFTIIFLMAMWQFKKLQTDLNRDRRDPCKKIEWDIWVILAWDLASAAWWWFNFGRHLHKPTQFPAPGTLSWVSLWKYGYLISFHPYNCVLQDIPTVAWVTKWTLYTLSFIQWIASANIWRGVSSQNTSDYPAYNCLASQIPTAPGISTCSANQICSRDLLFRAYSFEFSGSFSPSPELGVFILFIMLSIAFFGRILFLFIFPCVVSVLDTTESFKEIREEMYESDFGYYGSVSMSSVLSIAFGAVTVYSAIVALQHGRETAVAVDWACKTVHVTLSPRRYYLDVQYQLPVRVAQMWFNV